MEAIFVIDRSEWRRWRTGCKADRAGRGPRSCFARRSLFTSLRVPSPSIDFMLDRSRLCHHPRRLFQTFRSIRIRSGIVHSTWLRGNEPSWVDTIHQPNMFIIRRCTRTHIYTHIHVRTKISYSRQITGHASSREAKCPFETLSPLLSRSSTSSKRPENSPFTFSHLLPPP